MQTSNRKVIIGGFLMLAMLLMLSAMTAFAQDGGRGKGGFDGRKMHGRGHKDGGRFARNLNLSEAQQAQIQQISDRYKESTKGLREQMRNLRGSNEASEGSFNEAAVRQAAQARANLHVELEVARARMKAEMYAVLTPEQKAQLAQQKQERQQRRQQRMNRKTEGSSTIQQ